MWHFHAEPGIICIYEKEIEHIWDKNNQQLEQSFRIPILPEFLIAPDQTSNLTTYCYFRSLSARHFCSFSDIRRYTDIWDVDFVSQCISYTWSHVSRCYSPLIKRHEVILYYDWPWHYLRSRSLWLLFDTLLSFCFLGTVTKYTFGTLATSLFDPQSLSLWRIPIISFHSFWGWVRRASAKITAKTFAQRSADWEAPNTPGKIEENSNDVPRFYRYLGILNISY